MTHNVFSRRKKICHINQDRPTEKMKEQRNGTMFVELETFQGVYFYSLVTHYAEPLCISTSKGWIHAIEKVFKELDDNNQAYTHIIKVISILNKYF